MAITRDDVLHVAKLARLELGDAEVSRLVKDLGGILEHVAELAKVDTSGVPPTAYVAVEAIPFRPDDVITGVERDVALAEAPRSAEGGFAVPGYVDEG
jgi:aspartyl-tRNA(Asn)/glutamyl-tRNA(Gln) amidotransferase subunit C